MSEHDFSGTTREAKPIIVLLYEVMGVVTTMAKMEELRCAINHVTAVKKYGIINLFVQIKIYFSQRDFHDAASMFVIQPQVYMLYVENMVSGTGGKNTSLKDRTYFYSKVRVESKTNSLTHSLTHSLTTWCRVDLKKSSVALLLKKLPTFYESRKFITVFTRGLQWPLS
jgi:hypothetical protein